MKRHVFDAFSFLSGLLFVAIATVALVGGISLDVRFDVAWVLPVLLIGAGLALLASIASTRRRATAADDDLAVAGVTRATAVETDHGRHDPVATALDPAESSAPSAEGEPRDG